MDSKKKNWVNFKAIKERVSLEMVLKHYGIWAKLKKSGKNMVGQCPLCSGESDRGFSVDPKKNLFNCFQCNAGGNVLDFVGFKEFESKEMDSIRKAALKVQEWFPDPDPGKQGSGDNKRVVKIEIKDELQIALIDRLLQKGGFRDEQTIIAKALELLYYEVQRLEIARLAAGSIDA